MIKGLKNRIKGYGVNIGISEEAFSIKEAAGN